MKTHITVLVIFLLLLAAAPIFGQLNFEQRIDIGATTNAYTIVQGYDGGYIILGRCRDSSTPPNMSRIVIIKTDESGKISWAKSSFLIISDYAASLFTTHDSGFAYVTTVVIAQNFHSVIIKCDRDGKEQWRKILGTTIGRKYSYGLKGIESKDHGYVILSATSTMFGSVTKLDSNGQWQWSQSVRDNPTGNTAPNLTDIVSLDDGSFYVYGFEFYAFHRSALIHLSPAGHVISQTLYKTDSLYNHEKGSMLQTKDKGIVLCETIADTNNTSFAYFFKLDFTGRNIWSSKINIPASILPGVIAESKNGDLVFVGTLTNDTHNGTIAADSILSISLGSMGEVHSVKMLAIPNIGSDCTSIIQTRDGNLALVGDMERITAENGGVGNTGIFMMKFDLINDPCNFTNEPYSQSLIIVTMDSTNNPFDPQMTVDTQRIADLTSIAFEVKDLCSNAVVTTPTVLSNRVIFYPNPLSNRQHFTIHIDRELSAGAYNIILFDLSGRILKKETKNLSGMNQDILFDVSEYTAGAYIIEVKYLNDPTRCYRSKFIIQ